VKVTYNWLKDFLNIKISPEVLAKELTMAGLEVVSLEEAQGDFIFEIEITSNRPDWLSVLGVAREVAAITKAKLKIADIQEPKIATQDILPARISILDQQGCSFYSLRVIRDVKVGPSPSWLKKRLELLGCRSVNNVVDITNYCLFALGHPLHAFDLDKLNLATLIVRRAKALEKITTIDNQQKLLSPEILVIADRDRPVAIAGVMGGKDTEVTFGTRNIALESAVFNPVLVRRGRQKLGLQSESAYRFERGVDLENAKNASLMAQKLICELAHGKPSGKKSLGASKPLSASVKLDVTYVNRVLGTKITTLQIKQILSRLGFIYKIQTKHILLVKSPTFRQDIKSSIDLVEEIARIYGYGEIPQTLPAVKPSRKVLDKQDVVFEIKNILSSLGLNEAITYSLVDRQLLARFEISNPSGLIEILNPLSKEQEILRPTLLPSLVRCLAYNLNQQQEYVNIFEVANIFLSNRQVTHEELSLGIALCGAKSSLVQQGLIKEEVTLLHLKGILERLFNKLGIPGYDFKNKGVGQISVVVGQQEVGTMLDLSNHVLAAFDIKNKQVILAQISLDKVFAFIDVQKKFLEISRYPAITRDISFIVQEDVSVKDLIRAIEEQGLPLLYLAKVVDYYQGKQIPAGFRGLTISCVYRAADRTLTEEELAPKHNFICALLEEKFGIKPR